MFERSQIIKKDGKIHKSCSKCHQFKPLSEFYPSSGGRLGLYSWCIPCDKIKKEKYRKEHFTKNRQNQKRSYQKIKLISEPIINEHSKNIIKQNNTFYKKCSKCCRLMELDNFHHCSHNKSKLSSQCKECRNKKVNLYRLNRLEQTREGRRRHYRKHAHDPLFRLIGSLRNRIGQAIKNKSNHTLVLLGCTALELKEHLEKQFKPGMTWDNYGRGPKKWSVDHIIPFGAFDLNKKEEQEKCCHYSNLRPLWGKENASKCDLLPNGERARDLANIKPSK
jgi:hypothetical protein